MVVRVLWNRSLNQVLTVVSVQLRCSPYSGGRRQSLIEVRRWLLDAYHKVSGPVLAARVILRDNLLLLLLLHVYRLRNNVAMIYRVNFAIIIHQ